MITKLCMIVTYDEGNSPIISGNYLTTKSREVTWQSKNEISSLPQRLWEQMCQDGDLQWEEIIYNIKRLADRVVTWGQVTN